ncbi:MAG: 2,6-beta-D-fructofuranosidase, partial [Planctomycetota bacterium]
MNRSILTILLVCCSVSITQAAEDILIADFEAKTYGDWKAAGEAFGPGPAKGTLAGQMNVSGFEGKGLANSYYKGDKATGTLTSPPFEIQRKYINFLIGGGAHPGKACINLLVDDKIVRTATGPNDRPGGSEALDWHSWDVSDLSGKTAHIQIVDQAKGGWGHINIDQIVQGDKKSAVEKVPESREMVFAKKYLNMPVKHGAAKRTMDILIDGKIVRQFVIELAEGEPDYWVWLNVSEFKGKTATLKLNASAGKSNGLEKIYQDDAIKDADTFYKEKNRQQFHFSSRRGWNNDSNGMVYYDGEYHL